MTSFPAKMIVLSVPSWLKLNDKWTYNNFLCLKQDLSADLDGKLHIESPRTPVTCSDRSSVFKTARKGKRVIKKMRLFYCFKAGEKSFCLFTKKSFPLICPGVLAKNIRWGCAARPWKPLRCTRLRNSNFATLFHYVDRVYLTWCKLV